MPDVHAERQTQAGSELSCTLFQQIANFRQQFLLF